MTLHLATSDTEYEAWLDTIASTPAERAAQRDIEQRERVLGIPAPRPSQTAETPAKKQPRRFGDNPDDLTRPIDPRIFNLRPRHRSRSCNHGGGQS